MYKSSLNIFFFLITMLYNLLLLLPINKWVNKKKREIKKEKKILIVVTITSMVTITSVVTVTSGDDHQR